MGHVSLQTIVRDMVWIPANVGIKVNNATVWKWKVAMNLFIFFQI